jgi:hypothetical protein
MLCPTMYCGVPKKASRLLGATAEGVLTECAMVGHAMSG